MLNNEKKYQEIIDENSNLNVKAIVIFTLMIAFILISLISIFSAWEGFANRWQVNLQSIFDAMLHPNFELLYVPGEGFNMDMATGVIPNALASLAIAIIGTVFGMIFAILLGIKASPNFSKNASRYKIFFTVLRTFPPIILGVMMLMVVGPTAFAGALAIGIGSIGMLGKITSEIVEEVDMGIAEALYATGSSKRQVIIRSVLPELKPKLVGLFLYRLDINVRDSIMIGLVGAGGIGKPLYLSLQGQNWEDVFMWLYVTLFLVLIIEVISTYVRNKIR